MASSPQTSGKAETRRVPRKRVRLLYEHRISLYSLLVALPGIVVSGVLIWLQPWSTESKLAISLVELLVWWVLALALHEQTVRPLQTLANIVAALREEDYSFRARGATRTTRWESFRSKSTRWPICSPISESAPSKQLHFCAGSWKKSMLRCLHSIPDRVLRLVNPAGEKLLQQAAVRLLGRTADEIGLADCLSASE